MKKQKLKKTLAEKTSCRIQHTGWCCGTCFFAISKKLTNKDWQSLLLFRGDYKKKELTNLPRNPDKSIEKIAKLCG